MENQRFHPPIVFPTQHACCVQFSFRPRFRIASNTRAKFRWITRTAGTLNNTIQTKFNHQPKNFATSTNLLLGSPKRAGKKSNILVLIVLPLIENEYTLYYHVAGKVRVQNKDSVINFLTSFCTRLLDSIFRVLGLSVKQVLHGSQEKLRTSCTWL